MPGRASFSPVTLFITLFALANGASIATMPPAPAGNAVDTYFGVKVADPYRWLEDMQSAESRQWLRAAADDAAQALAAIPGRDRLLARIEELEAATGTQIGRVTRLPGDRYVYESRGVHENQFKIVMRQGLDGVEKVLVDPQALASKHGGTPMAVNYFSMSPNGRFLAYGVSAGGSEAAELHLLDTRNGRALGSPVSRADFGIARWAPDSRHFAFVRLREPDGNVVGKYEGSAVWYVPVAGGMGKAREILGPNTTSLKVLPREIPDVHFTSDGRWLIGVLEDGVRRDLRLAVAPVSSLRSGQPAWSLRIGRDDKIVDFAYAQGTLYASTYADSPRYKIVAAPIASFSAVSAPVVVPASDRVLGMLVAARDALYFDAREGNAKQLWRLAYSPKAIAQRVNLPVQGNFSLRQRGGVWAAHAKVDGVLISIEGWTSPQQIYAVSADGRVGNTGLQPDATGAVGSDIETTEVLVASSDGARVPLSIVHKRGLRLDGRNPVLLQGYGAYGITQEARYAANRLAWLEQGGVFAFANPRGSGVFGQAWYEAGKQATKPNTWRDMIACAEYLVETGYAAPATLAIEGGSAGGITAGRAATERPDLFAAMVARVGVLDAVRAELGPNGPPNIPEFGTHKTEAGFRGLLAMSTYHQIRDGVSYPAVLLMHGINDPRVDPWQSAKAAARFAAASASTPNGKPVLLRIDYESGHGVGSTKSQRQAEAADIYAFLLWQMGRPDYQPGGARQ